MKKHLKKKIYLLVALFLASVGCKNIVEVPAPTNSLTTQQVFSSATTATAALVAIYQDMISNQSNLSYANGLTTLNCGLSADELLSFNLQNDTQIFQNNQLVANDGYILNYFWANPYFDIYMANGVIQGLQASTSVPSATKNQLIGEAQFLRAYIYFYMVNLFGGVPLATTTAYAHTENLPRASTAEVYSQIIADLKSAQSLLLADYSVSGNQRIRANKWAATALLARAYLYTAKWDSAAMEATQVIKNSSLYSLVPNLNNVFLANSNEAILQLAPNSQTTWATEEGYQILPSPLDSGNPNYYLTPQLLSAFENGDQRRVAWVDSTNYSGTVYYYPFKYKIAEGSANSVPEYYMLLRFAEQYLILAEAEANGAGGGTAAAVTDLNIIRARAGLAPLSSGLNSSQVMSAVMQERRIELFSEWGHRWFDLKRTGAASAVLSAISYKQPWNDDQLLYPIPYVEIQRDPNLKQNPGY